MTLNEYQQAALRTASGMNYEQYGAVMNAALGIWGEGGFPGAWPGQRARGERIR